MMNGVPYIMYDDLYYHELYKNGRVFQTDKIAVQILNNYLDKQEFRNEEAQEDLSWIRKKLIYKDKIIEMNNYMNDLLSKQKVMGDSDKLNEIIGWIKNNKSMTKQNIMNNLNWGRGIKWTPYRRTL